MAKITRRRVSGRSMRMNLNLPLTTTMPGTGPVTTGFDDPYGVRGWVEIAGDPWVRSGSGLGKDDGGGYGKPKGKK